MASRIDTILGGELQNTSAPRKRLNRILGDPLTASTVFQSGDFPKDGITDFNEFKKLFTILSKKAQSGRLTPQDREVLSSYRQFTERNKAFTSLKNRSAEIVKQREMVESSRRRSPGRTQTILTRREG